MPKERAAHSDKFTMNELNDNFDLISQMVNETFEVAENSTFKFEETEQVTENNQPLEQKNPFKEVEPIQLEFEYNYYLGGYDHQRSCYIFQVEDQVIEIPANWGPFRLTSYSEGVFEDMFKVEKHEDVDLFFDIIESISGQTLSSIKCQNQGNHLKLCFEVGEPEVLAEVIPFNSKSFVEAA